MIAHVVFFQAQNNSSDDTIICDGIKLGADDQSGREEAVSNISKIKSSGKVLYNESNFSSFYQNEMYLFEIISEERDSINRKMPISFLTNHAPTDDLINTLKEAIKLSGRVYDERYSQQIKKAIEEKKKKKKKVKIILVTSLVFILALMIFFLVASSNNYRDFYELTETNQTQSH